MKAQYLNHIHLNHEKGLPCNEVYQMIQDDIGYIYFATNNGLYKFDGFKYKQIKCSVQNASALSHLLKNSKGVIWCHNFAGQIYYVRNDSLVLFKSFQQENTVYVTFTIDAQDNIWIPTRQALCCYNERGDLLKSIAYGGADYNAYSISLTDKNLPLFCESHRGYNVVRQDKIDTMVGEPIFKHRSLGFKNKYGSYILVEVTPFLDYYIYEIKENRPVLFQHFNKNQLAKNILFFRRHKNKMYYGTSNGLFVYDIEQLAAPALHLLPNESVSSILIDKEENLWVSTLGNGVYFFNALSTAKIDATNSETKSENFSALSIIENKVYFGNILGELFVKDETGIKRIDAPQQYLHRTVSKIRSHKNKLFVARGPLNVIGDGSNQIYLTQFIRDFVARDSLVYTVNSSGFLKYNIHTKTSQSLKEIAARKMEIDDKTGIIYIATAAGLMAYNGATYRDVEPRGQPIFAQSMCFNNGILWLGTLNNGVLGLQNDSIVYAFNESNILRGDKIYALRAMGENLFVVTNQTIHKINLINKVAAYFPHSGAIDLNGVSAIDVLHDTIYISSQSGVYYFAQQIHEPLSKTKLYFTGIQSQKDKYTDKHEFGYTENKLELQFKAISFRHFGKLKYRYRVNDGMWVSLNGLTDYIQFESLADGDYSIAVQAMNENNESLSSIETYKIRILRPFWKQWWFLIGSIVLTGLCIWYYVQYTVQKVRKQAEQAQQIIRSQLTALRAQMNPHFMFNAINSIQDLILQQDVKSANMYLSKFSSLLRNILSHSEKDKITLKEEVDMLQLYLELEKLRFGNEFEYSIITIDKYDDLQIPSMLIQPYVENAIKHGLLHKKGNKQLRIHFEYISNVLTCIVEDNGVGRKKSAEINAKRVKPHQSFATAATQKRMALYGNHTDAVTVSDILDTNGECVGTRIVLNIEVL